METCGKTSGSSVGGGKNICAFHVVKIFILGWLVTIEQHSKSSKKGS